jgi:hypothetical protein
MARDDLLNQLRRNLATAESAEGLDDQVKLIKARIAKQEKAATKVEVTPVEQLEKTPTKAEAATKASKK